jgi:crotonobetainyl-CoA:carnitine CoA-transferase CaiB-like acyl-CoA transferase
MTHGPLSGVRVLDLSRVLAGPWATQTLADLGAEVIKIERPGAGDDTRHWGPPFTTRTDGSKGDAAYFLCANRGKKSVELDIATPEGAAIIRELTKTCDILVENFKTGGLRSTASTTPPCRRSTPGSSIARSRASARTVPTPIGPATTT